MVGNRNHPLDFPHYDEDTLEECVLGQLLPDEEAQIRQHLTECPWCRAKVADIGAFCRQVSHDLRQELDGAKPSSQLSFDRLASEWRKPPRRMTHLFHLPQLSPSAPLMLLITLFAAAFLLLVSPNDTAALRDLDLVKEYHGPPAVVAAATDNGVVVVRLASGEAEVIMRLSYVRNPRHLQLSPDSRWLAFQEGRTLHIVQVQEEGESVRFRVHETADWTWAPDSHALAYTDGAGQLAVFDVGSQTTNVLVPADEFAWGAPVWTADSQQIAYAVVNPLPTSGGPYLRQGIWRSALATGYRVELARNPAPDDVLLVPAAWADGDSVLLAWDMTASVEGYPPVLYRVDVSGHGIRQIEGYSLAQGTRLAWSVGPQGTTLVTRQSGLFALELADESEPPLFIAEQIPWPQMIDWAPNGAWMAYTVTGAAAGEGVYLFAVDEAELRAVKLPGGATEKAVFWAGAEHLFVIRQPQDTFVVELWLAPLTTGEPAQRILTGVRLPSSGPFNGWNWQDVLAMQVITASG